MPKIPGIDFQIQNALSAPITLLNDQNTFATILTLSSISIKAAIIEYSIIRSNTTESGSIFVSTDGSTLSFQVKKSDNNNTGISLYGTLSGSDILIQYLSTNTGQTGAFKYAIRTLN